MAENNPFPGENNTGHFWDDNLRELKNPPPKWWMIALWASLAWFIAYTVLYPSWPMPFQTENGEGYTKGILGWTSIKEYEKGVAQVEAVRAPYDERISGSGVLTFPDGTDRKDLKRAAEVAGAKRVDAVDGGGYKVVTTTESFESVKSALGEAGFTPSSAELLAPLSAEQIIADDGLNQFTLASAKVLFGDYCAACHGSGGQGNPGYPVLADDDWLYGGSLNKITESITNGRKGAMTAHANILTEQEVDSLANFVVELAEGGAGSEAGWELYNTKGCQACHGAKADGVLAELPNGDIVTVGAANLTDSIWRFRPGGYESAKYTILHGVNQPGIEGTRDAVMPGFAQLGQLEGKLTSDQIKMLTVYVHQLGGGQ